MSVDNVIAIAGASKDSIGLVVFGLLVSVPIIVWGSKLVLMLMDRFPMVIVAGAALLGWIAGDMAVGDVVTKDWVAANAAWLKYGGPIIGAAGVVIAGRLLYGKPKPPGGGAPAAPVDLASNDPK